jgi:Cytochrome P450
MHMGFRSATLDIIMEYAFAQSFDTLGARHFRHPTLVRLQEGLPGRVEFLDGMFELNRRLEAFAIFRHFKFVPKLMLLIPRWLLTWLSPGTQGVVDVLTICERQCEEVLANPSSLQEAAHEIIYHHLVTPEPGKRARMPSKTQLIEEAQVLLRAGSDTVGNTCTVGTFHVLNSKAILARLRAELDGVRTDEDSPFNFEVLEKLPYLVGRNVQICFLLLMVLCRPLSSKSR